MAIATVSSGPSELERDQQLGRDLQDTNESLETLLSEKLDFDVSEAIVKFRRQISGLSRIIELNGAHPDTDLEITQNRRIFFFIDNNRSRIDAVLKKARQRNLTKDADDIQEDLEWLAKEMDEFHTVLTGDVDVYLQTR